MSDNESLLQIHRVIMRDWALWSKFDTNDGVWRKDGHVRSNSPLNHWQAGEIERVKHSIMPANKAN